MVIVNQCNFDCKMFDNERFYVGKQLGKNDFSIKSDHVLNIFIHVRKLQPSEEMLSEKLGRKMHLAFVDGKKWPFSAALKINDLNVKVEKCVSPHITSKKDKLKRLVACSNLIRLK